MSDDDVQVSTFGEAMVVLAPANGGALRDAPLLARYVGGAELNVAVALARLGHHSAWAGAVGDDPLGQIILDRLRAEGVDLAHVRVVPGARTGMYLREWLVGNRLQAHYHRRDTAASAVTAADLDPTPLAGRVLHLTGITPLLSTSCAEACRWLAGEARRRGMEICLDANLRWRLIGDRDPAGLLAPLIEASDILVMAEAEADVLLGGHGRADLERYRGAGYAGLVVVHGSDSALAVGAEGHAHRPALRVPVLDPVGAGDAFVAGLLSARLDGAPLGTCLEVAHAAAACAVGTAGDAESMPRAADLRALSGDVGVER